MRQLGFLATLVAIPVGCGRIGFDSRLGATDAPVDTVADAPDALPADLVAYYPMDSISGTLILDVAHDHDATCTDCPTGTPGRVDGALAFDGTVDLATVPSDPTLELATGFTVTVFANIAAAPATRACVATKGLAGSQRNSWAVCIEPSRQVFFFTSTANTTDNQFSTALVSTGEWHHLAIRWNGTMKSIFVDGALDGMKAAVTEFDSDSIRIGGDLDANVPTAYFTGAIDELRIYNRPLDAVEIAALAAPP